MGLTELRPMRFHSKVTRENEIQNSIAEWVQIGRSSKLKEEADHFVRISTTCNQLAELSPFMPEQQYAAQVVRSLMALRDKYISTEQSSCKITFSYSLLIPGG